MSQTHSDIIGEVFVCFRCRQRISGNKNVETYINSFVETDSEDGPCNKYAKDSVCSCCLGLLQRFASKEFVQSSVIDVIKSSKFEFSSFVLNVSFPASFLIRHRSVALHLKQAGKIDRISDLISVKEVWKWIIGTYIEKEFAAKLNIDSPFHIYMTVSYPDVIEDCHFLSELYPDSFSKDVRKLDSTSFSNKLVNKFLENTTDSDIMKHCIWPLKEPNVACSYGNIFLENDSIYLAGKYNKYSRNLSQTPWLVGGEKIMESSVQELIVDHVSQVISAKGVVFSASGREDVDVRCLGQGRPFVLELVNPKRVSITQDELFRLQKKINSSSSDIAVKHLQVVSKNDIQKLKEGEEEKTKTYTALCCCKDELTQAQLDILATLKNLTLYQQTPIRVLHRRNLDTRKRMIHSMSATLIDKHKFELNLITEAGTYIKEFVHGDFGRTNPCLENFLKTETDIINLDVQDINLDWPPSIEEPT